MRRDSGAGRLRVNESQAAADGPLREETLALARHRQSLRGQIGPLHTTAAGEPGPGLASAAPGWRTLSGGRSRWTSWRVREAEAGCGWWRRSRIPRSFSAVLARFGL